MPLSVSRFCDDRALKATTVRLKSLGFGISASGLCRTSACDRRGVRVLSAGRPLCRPRRMRACAVALPVNLWGNTVEAVSMVVSWMSLIRNDGTVISPKPWIAPQHVPARWSSRLRGTGHDSRPVRRFVPRQRWTRPDGGLEMSEDWRGSPLTVSAIAASPDGRCLLLDGSHRSVPMSQTTAEPRRVSSRASSTGRGASRQADRIAVDMISALAHRCQSPRGRSQPRVRSRDGSCLSWVGKGSLPLVLRRRLPEPAS